MSPSHLFSNSPNYLSNNSYDISFKNLVLDQLMISLFIFLFILIACLLDIVKIL